MTSATQLLFRRVNVAGPSQWPEAVEAAEVLAWCAHMGVTRGPTLRSGSEPVSQRRNAKAETLLEMKCKVKCKLKRLHIHSP